MAESSDTVRDRVMAFSPTLPLSTLIEEREVRTQTMRRIRPMAFPIKDTRGIDNLYARDCESFFNLDTEVPMEPATHDRLKNPLAHRTYKKLVSQAFTGTFNDEKYSYEDLLPYRIKVAWRLCRELARLQGRVRPDETLAEALHPTESNPDPWTRPKKWRPPTRGQSRSYRMNPEAVRVMQEISGLPADMQTTRWDFDKNIPVHCPGVAILPPDIPPAFRTDESRVKEDYDTTKDKALVLYVSLLKVLARSLYIEQGSTDDVHQGRYGMIGLMQHGTIRLTFPSILQIVTWEQMLVEKTLNYLIKNGRDRTREYLEATQGLRSHEVASLLKQARTLAREKVEADVEENRSIMVLRLEDYIHRSTEAMDLRSELQGIKQMSIIMGLAYNEADNGMKEFMDISTRVSSEPQAGKALLEGDFEDVEFEENNT